MFICFSSIQPKDIRLRIIGQLVNVHVLDGSSILEGERDAAESLLTTDLISPSLLETHSHVDLYEPHILSLRNTAQTLTCTSMNTPGKLKEDDPTSFSKVIHSMLQQVIIIYHLSYSLVFIYIYEPHIICKKKTRKFDF